MVTCEVRDINGKNLGSFTVKGEVSLLEEAENAGVDIPSSCRMGACLACGVKIIEGKELWENASHGDQLIDIEDDLVLTCIGSVAKKYIDDSKEYTLVVQTVI